MILFTGRGSIATSYQQQFGCKIISARSVSNEELIEGIKSASVIVHNAALIDSTDLSELITSNFTLTQRILDLVHQHNPRIRFLNISSMSFLQTYDRYFEAKDMSNYAFSKFISEQFCLRHPLTDLASVRFSTLFYKDDRKDGISRLISDAVLSKSITLYNQGEAKRDILPLNVAVDYLRKLTVRSKVNRTINLASGTPWSFGDVAAILKADDPELRINNVVLEKPKQEVLCDFPKDNIIDLGEITFDLAEEIRAYKKVIYENADIQ